MTQELESLLAKQGFRLYPQSLWITDSGVQIFVAKQEGRKLVGIIRKPRRKHPELFSPISSAIKLSSGEVVSLHPLTWANYERLRTILPIAPVAAGNQTSFGTGDRLGLVSAAHINALSRYPVFPVIAQQSPRELAKTGRDFQHVLLKAVMGVLETGYRGQYGADADHIKDEHHLAMGIEAGYSMYTIDVSDWIQNPRTASPEHLSPLARRIVAE
ncbi:MAG: tagaturonate epimerase family protein, partial [Armatimonadota bacterium]